MDETRRSEPNPRPPSSTRSRSPGSERAVVRAEAIPGPPILEEEEPDLRIGENASVLAMRQPALKHFVQETALSSMVGRAAQPADAALPVPRHHRLRQAIAGPTS